MPSTSTSFSGFHFKRLINQKKLNITDNKILNLVSNELIETLSQIKIQKQSVNFEDQSNLRNEPKKNISVQPKLYVTEVLSRKDVVTKDEGNISDEISASPLPKKLIETSLQTQKVEVSMPNEKNFLAPQLSYRQPDQEINVLPLYNSLTSLNEIQEDVESGLEHNQKRKYKKFFKEATPESLLVAYYL